MQTARRPSSTIKQREQAPTDELIVCDGHKLLRKVEIQFNIEFYGYYYEFIQSCYESRHIREPTKKISYW